MSREVEQARNQQDRRLINQTTLRAIERAERLSTRNQLNRPTVITVESPYHNWWIRELRNQPQIEIPTSARILSPSPLIPRTDDDRLAIAVRRYSIEELSDPESASIDEERSPEYPSMTSVPTTSSTDTEPMTHAVAREIARKLPP